MDPIISQQRGSPLRSSCSTGNYSSDSVRRSICSMSCGYMRINRPLSSSSSHPSVRSSTSVPRSVSPLLISITTDAGGSGTSMRGHQGYAQVNHHPISNTGLASSTIVLPLDSRQATGCLTARGCRTQAAVIAENGLNYPGKPAGSASSGAGSVARPLR